MDNNNGCIGMDTVSWVMEDYDAADVGYGKDARICGVQGGGDEARPEATAHPHCTADEAGVLGTRNAELAPSVHVAQDDHRIAGSYFRNDHVFCFRDGAYPARAGACAARAGVSGVLCVPHGVHHVHLTVGFVSRSSHALLCDAQDPFSQVLLMFVDVCFPRLGACEQEHVTPVSSLIGLWVLTHSCASRGKRLYQVLKGFYNGNIFLETQKLDLGHFIIRD